MGPRCKTTSESRHKLGQQASSNNVLHGGYPPGRDTSSVKSHYRVLVQVYNPGNIIGVKLHLIVTSPPRWGIAAVAATRLQEHRNIVTSIMKADAYDVSGIVDLHPLTIVSDGAADAPTKQEA